jgi:hypothetical protein
MAQIDVPQTPEPRPHPGSRAVVRADLLPGLGVLGAVAVLGVPLGWLWSRLVPPEFVVLSARAAGPDGVLPFVGQSAHRFDGMATFVLLGLAAGVLTGAALWLLRPRRGPLVLVAAVLGSLIAGWLAMRVGLWLAAGRYPDLSGAGMAFPRAPVLESAWVVIVQPFGAAVAYSLAVVWNNADDLGSAPG